MAEGRPHCIPRALADDLLLETHEFEEGSFPHELAAEHTQAVQETIDFVLDFGSRISPTKRVSLSSSSEVRRALRAHKYGRIGAGFSVCSSVRDLGAHIS
eukprot:10934283-Alexandrium_andersonii.AAC.1